MAGQARISAPVCTPLAPGSEPDVLRSPPQPAGSLDRKVALPLAVVRARRASQDVFNDWSVAMTDRKPLRSPLQIVQRVRDAGIRNAAFMDLEQYIKRCPYEDRCPEPEGILNSLIPRGCKNGLHQGRPPTRPPSPDDPEVSAC